MHIESQNPKNFEVAEELNASSSAQAHRIGDPLRGSGGFLAKAMHAAPEIGETSVGPVTRSENKENETE